jgi:hypothetical protein
MSANPSQKEQPCAANPTAAHQLMHHSSVEIHGVHAIVVIPEEENTTFLS